MRPRAGLAVAYLGFVTERDAHAWIVNDKRLTDDTALFVTTPGM
jgi:hypothetical protein